MRGISFENILGRLKNDQIEADSVNPLPTERDSTNCKNLNINFLLVELIKLNI